MNVLGVHEVPLAAPREIRKLEVPLAELLGPNDDALVVSVPRASVMITIDNSPGRSGKATLYYECPVGAAEDLKVRLLGCIVGDEVPGEYRPLGYFWHGRALGALISVYVHHLGE